MQVFLYELTSNPFRANYSMNETDATMGWTLSTAWSNGRRSEVETFAGAALPVVFGGNNTNSTGKVVTEIDGNATTVTDQAGKRRRSITNALGQLIRVDEPDAAGNLGSVSAPVQPTYYFYDALNNLTQVVQAGSGAEQCGPAGGNCSQTRTFTYNSLSRLVSATNPESGTILYQYDANGNLTQKTDARGVVTTYVYDALNRVTQRNYSTPNGTPGVGLLSHYQPTPNVSYFYDGSNQPGGIPYSKGKLTKVSSSVSTTEYTAFDILGRVTAHKQTTDGVAYTTGYAYNLAGALIEQTYPSGRVVKNTLDADGQLQQVERRKANDTFCNYANAFSYTAAGAVSAMRLGNSLWEITQFNSRLQPTQIGLGTGSAVQNRLRLDYAYGELQPNGTIDATKNNGNLTRQTITVPTVITGGTTHAGFTAVQSYQYDSLNRLKSAVENVQSLNSSNQPVGSQSLSWRQTFTFDRYGNRRFDTSFDGNGQSNTTTLLPNCPVAVCNPEINPANNRLSSPGWQYDAAGNTIQDAEGRSFIYDGENKQTEVRNAQNQTIGKYYFDGDGKRVKKVVPSTGETTVFVYDASAKLVAEYSTIVEPQSTAKISYLSQDHLGSPRILTDQNGAVISRRDFLPYGEEIFSPERTQSLGYTADTIHQKFTGYERDNETNLDYAKARYFC